MTRWLYVPRNLCFVVLYLLRAGLIALWYALTYRQKMFRIQREEDETLALKSYSQEVMLQQMREVIDHQDNRIKMLEHDRKSILQALAMQEELLHQERNKIHD